MTAQSGAQIQSLPRCQPWLDGPVASHGVRSHHRLFSGTKLFTAVATLQLEERGLLSVASRVGVGLGWKIGSLGGRRFLNHEGGGAGFTSELRLYPELGIGVAVGMNAMRAPSTMLLAHQLCEMVVADFA